MAANNPFLLAADNSPSLLVLLRSDPSIASSQDQHGYSLMHAAASYNHTSLLRDLVHEFHVDVNLKDEDGETALFVVETVEAAQVLVEELGTDINIKSLEGLTAEEKIRTDGEFPVVAEYLLETRTRGFASGQTSTTHLPPLPPGITVNVGTINPSEDSIGEADPEFKRRIDELAARDDFRSEEGQRELRSLIQDAVRGVSGDERVNRRRVEE